MREYGGYIELDDYGGEEYHKGAAALNCGRNCLACLIEARHIRRIMLPRFLCPSMAEVCEKRGLALCKLEVARTNGKAPAFYEARGYHITEKAGPDSLYMEKRLTEA